MTHTLGPIILQGSVWKIVQDSSTFGLVILAILLTMSVISWVVIFHKWRQFSSVERDTEKFIQFFRHARRLDEVMAAAKNHHRSPLASIYRVGSDELASLVALSGSGNPNHQAKNLTDKEFDILEMTMEKTMTEEMGKLERLTVYLATTSSSAPFLGLLGTVVGIMDSFWSIGERGSASLAVVAPGIAEALLATIVGLGAAIPAVIGFNWANSKTKFMHDAATGFILEFLARAKKEAL
jgi:biopolymer transport protein TolQ